MRKFTLKWKASRMLTHLQIMKVQNSEDYVSNYRTRSQMNGKMGMLGVGGTAVSLDLFFNNQL